MKFELDEYYFNRAGDKVRYVGYTGFFNHGIKSNVFRDVAGAIYSVNEGGCYLPFEIGNAAVSECDILGKWEIADDPDRVYVIGGEEHRAGNIGDSKYNFWRTDSEYFYAKFGDIDRVQKILIKPPCKKIDWSKMPNGAREMYKQLHDKAIKSKKIEPLTTPPDGMTYDNINFTHVVREKINELIAAHNTAK